MQVSGVIATQVADVARSLGKVIGVLGKCVRPIPPVVLLSFEEFIAETLDLLKLLKIGEVAAAGERLSQGQVVLVKVDEYRNLSYYFFTKAGQCEQHSRLISYDAAEMRKHVNAASQQLHAALLDYFSSLQRMFGDLLEGI